MTKFARRTGALLFALGALCTLACGGRVALDALGDQASRGTGEAVDGSAPPANPEDQPDAWLASPSPTPPAPGPAPGSGTGASTRIVFITGPAGPWWHIADADALCQSEGAAAGWKGTFKAWLSDGSTSPATRLVHSAVPYVTPLGQVVAASWSDLTTKPLSRAIDQSADGGPAWHYDVWTGTAPNGTGSGAHCGVGASVGTMGNVTSTGASWTADRVAPCGSTGVIYCFEQ